LVPQRGFPVSESVARSGEVPSRLEKGDEFFGGKKKGKTFTQEGGKRKGGPFDEKSRIPGKTSTKQKLTRSWGTTGRESPSTLKKRDCPSAPRGEKEGAILHVSSSWGTKSE